jgi:hypothetical protein
MIRRFDKKLRMAGLEDTLQYELGVNADTASWLARLAYDAAARQQIDLLAFRGPALVSQFFWQLEGAGFDGLLDRVGVETPTFGKSLAAHRATFSEPAWQAAA